MGRQDRAPSVILGVQFISPGRDSRESESDGGLGVYVYKSCMMLHVSGYCQFGVACATASAR